MIFRVEEMTPSDLGLTRGQYGEWVGDDNIWEDIDLHNCHMGTQCVCVVDGHDAAPLAFHLRGEHDQPEWFTPFKVDVFVGDHVLNLYVCEDCAMAITRTLLGLGFKEVS